MSDSTKHPKGAHPTPPDRPNGARSSLRIARRWSWAYRKIRSLHCGILTASWRATRFALFGNTGRFISRHGWTKLRLSDE